MVNELVFVTRRYRNSARIKLVAWKIPSQTPVLDWVFIVDILSFTFFFATKDLLTWVFFRTIWMKCGSVRRVWLLLASWRWREEKKNLALRILRSIGRHYTGLAHIQNIEY